MPTPCCPLFAAGFDWLEALLPFLFVAFWIISQVFAVIRRLNRGPQPPARIDRPRTPPGGDVRSELERQIEEFLRQSAGEQSRRPSVAPDTVPARPSKESPAGRKPGSGATAPRPAAPPSRTNRERLAGGALEARRAARPVADAAGKAVAVPAPAQPSAESVARHVQDAFSHDLAHSRGTLAHESTITETVTPSTSVLAAELVEMVRSPAATRRAILLREVLERPVDRW